MIALFDLDYTLLDTQGVKALISKALGIDLDTFTSDSDRLFASKGRSYDLQDHIRDRQPERLLEEVERAISQTIAESRDTLLLSGAVRLLDLWKRKGIRLDLMTRGNPEYQRFKVESLGLANYFHEIAYVEGKKSEQMQGYAHCGETVLVVNDNVKETEQMRAAAPDAVYFIVPGPYSEGAIDSEFSLTTLNALEKLDLQDLEERSG